jgi:hypothetical protein
MVEAQDWLKIVDEIEELKSSDLDHDIKVNQLVIVLVRKHAIYMHMSTLYIYILLYPEFEQTGVWRQYPYCHNTSKLKYH